MAIGLSGEMSTTEVPTRNSDLSFAGADCSEVDGFACGDTGAAEADEAPANATSRADAAPTAAADRRWDISLLGKHARKTRVGDAGPGRVHDGEPRAPPPDGPCQCRCDPSQ